MQTNMNILFLCTGNSCRSVLSEATFNHLAPAGLKAISAGSQPAGQLHPRAVALLRRKGISTDGYYSKSWDALPANARHRRHRLRQRGRRNLLGLPWPGTAHALGRGRPEPCRSAREEEIDGRF
jgi:hypothetical protein